MLGRIRLNLGARGEQIIDDIFQVPNNLSHISSQHTWPPDCTLSINGTYMNLCIKKQTKPSAPPHPDKPLDISKECRSGRNTMEVTTSSSRHYAVVVDVMRVISVDTLVDAVMKNKTMSFESAKKTISLSLSGGDGEIAALHTTISLQCPLGRTPLVLPVKSLSCRHIQCFDLKNYLMMNQRTPSWKCPVCSAVANTTNLVIDAYFTELLHNVDSQTVNEVHIDPSGNWSTAKPHKTITPKPEPTSPVLVRASNGPSVTPIKSVAPSPQKPKRPVEVIDLLSDDDDDVVPVPPKRAKSDVTHSIPPSINISSPPPSPLSYLPPTTSSTATTTTGIYSPYAIISSPPPTPPTSLSAIKSSSSSISPIELYSPVPSSASLRDSTSIAPPVTDTQSNVPLVTTPEDLLPTSPPNTADNHFEPNLQSDLASPPLVPTSDTPPETKKKAGGIIVKLSFKNPQKSLPSSPLLQSLTSPTSPTPPAPSVPSESSDSLNSLEVPNLAASFSSGNSTGRYAANHHYSPNSSPGEYGHHWPQSSYSTSHPNYPSSNEYNESYNHAEPHKHHENDCEDCECYSDRRSSYYNNNNNNNNTNYPDNYQYANHANHSEHSDSYARFRSSHDYHEYHGSHKSHSRHDQSYNEYNDPYTYSDSGAHYDQASYEANNSQYLPPSATHSHPSNYYNGYFDSDEDARHDHNTTNINSHPPTVTHSPTSSLHALPHQPTPPSGTTISTTTTTTTTTTAHGTTSMTLMSSYLNGSAAAPVIVLSDDEDDDHDEDGGDYP